MMQIIRDDKKSLDVLLYIVFVLLSLQIKIIIRQYWFDDERNYILCCEILIC